MLHQGGGLWWAWRWVYAAALLVATGCGDSDEKSAERPRSPSDDPADWDVDTSVSYDIVASKPRFVVPSPELEAVATPGVSNANVDIHFFEGRLYLAWRAAPFHFANADTRMVVVSSDDDGESWELEHEIHIGADMREPRFFDVAGGLHLMFFEAGTNPLAFEPQRVWRARRRSLGKWTDNELLFDAPEVPWDVKTRSGTLWMTSYAGEHYGVGDVDAFFKTSDDGNEWREVDETSYVYRGGVSEVAFEFDADGSLWAVTRNEDGDDSGWGSHVCYAASGSLGTWECPSVSDPERYDSPEMFRHGSEIYLVARRDIGGPFGGGDSPGDLVAYSTRPKTTALYRIDKTDREVVHLFDLPGAGDTAFPSVRRTGAHTFLLANYTSPLDEPDITWLAGQTSERGTQIYFLTLTFQPE